jgi:hypothetical protein
LLPAAGGAIAQNLGHTLTAATLGLYVNGSMWQMIV